MYDGAVVDNFYGKLIKNFFRIKSFKGYYIFIVDEDFNIKEEYYPDDDPNSSYYNYYNPEKEMLPNEYQVWIYSSDMRIARALLKKYIQDPYYKRWRTTQRTFSIPEHPDHPGLTEHPGIALTQAGTPDMVWYSKENGDLESLWLPIDYFVNQINF
jgi:hypothetical protein